MKNRLFLAIISLVLPLTAVLPILVETGVVAQYLPVTPPITGPITPVLTPTATPTATPVVTYVPTATPVVTFVPTFVPTATPITPPTVNRNPIISTRIIKPIAIKNRYYSAKVSAYDLDKTDKVNMSISGLPKGLIYLCSINQTLTPNKVECTISGKPTVSGMFYIVVRVTDSRGGATIKRFPLRVYNLPYFYR